MPFQGLICLSLRDGKEKRFSGLMYPGPQMPFWPHMPIHRPSRKSKLRVSCTQDLICPFWPHMPIHRSSRPQASFGSQITRDFICPFLAPSPIVAHHKTSAIIYDLKRPHLPFPYNVSNMRNNVPITLKPNKPVLVFMHFHHCVLNL